MSFYPLLLYRRVYVVHNTKKENNGNDTVIKILNRLDTTSGRMHDLVPFLGVLLLSIVFLFIFCNFIQVKNVKNMLLSYKYAYFLHNLIQKEKKLFPFHA